MYDVGTDRTRTLLLITFQARGQPAELARGRTEVAAALETMKPGFRLLTDLSGMDSMEYACAPEIEATMDLLRKKGVALVVRVVPDPHKDIGFKVMSYFHYGRKVPVLTLDTRAEALEEFSG